MPITPFHFGPGAAAYAVAPRHMSFLAFCASNVLIDIEPLYFMLRGQYPVHRFFHTYLGAVLVAATTVLLFLGARWLANRIWLPNLFGWRQLGIHPVTFGALIGTLSHVLLDSVMHRDVVPFAPFSDANALLYAVSVRTLYVSCVVAGALAIVVLYLRRLKKRNAR